MKANTDFAVIVTSMADILLLPVTEVVYMIDGLIPNAGLTILSGAIKLGKSWLALQIAVSIATGTLLLGRFKASKSPVLYIALEDDTKRIRRRLNRIGIESDLNISFAFVWPPMTEGINLLRSYCKANTSCRFIIIDTLGRFSYGRTKDGYQADYDFMASIRQVAVEFNISILLIHHNRKLRDEADEFMDVSGSTAITGSADSLIVLSRQRNSRNAKLSCTSRDFEESSIGLHFSTESCTWSIDGIASEPTLTPERQAIYKILKTMKEASPAGIAKTVGKTPQNISNILQRMCEDNIVQHGSRRGLWKCTPTESDLHESYVSYTVPDGTIDDKEF